MHAHAAANASASSLRLCRVCGLWQHFFRLVEPSGEGTREQPYLIEKVDRQRTAEPHPEAILQSSDGVLVRALPAPQSSPHIM